MRSNKIRNLLLMVGADTSDSTVALIDGLMSFIPTEYLKHFGEYLLKNYDRKTKPIVNITLTIQEYRRRLKLVMIQRGDKKLETVEETRDYLLEFYKGKDICNHIAGIYLPFVTIALNENEEFINKYSFKKLDSSDVSDFLYWCFLNQERIGDVKIIKSNLIEQMMTENKNKIDSLTLESKKAEDGEENIYFTTKLKSIVNVPIKRF